MRTSSRPNRSSGRRIGGRPAEEFESKRIGGGSDSLISVVDGAPQRVTHPRLAKARERLVILGTLVVLNI